MKTENVVCTRVEFACIDDIESFDESGTPVFKPGKNFKNIIADKAVLNETQKPENSGCLNEQQLNIKFFGNDVEPNELFRNMIFKLQTIEGNIIIFGTLKNPVQPVNIKKNGNIIDCDFGRKSTVMEF